MEIILNRRSIRKYKDKDISESEIKDLLRAGMSAPSAGNQQPWHFIIINKQQILEKIPKIHPYADFTPQASKAILVCGNLEEESHKGFWKQDCSAATQNILLAIQSKGLGGVWVGIYPVEERIEKFKKLFNLPKKIMPFSLIPVGYPAENKSPANRYQEKRIHKNKW